LASGTSESIAIFYTKRITALFVKGFMHHTIGFVRLVFQQQQPDVVQMREAYNQFLGVTNLNKILASVNKSLVVARGCHQ
jgi:hypothetical protein